MSCGGALPDWWRMALPTLDFKNALQNPLSDVTDTTSTFDTVYALDAATILQGAGSSRTNPSKPSPSTALVRTHVSSVSRPGVLLHGSLYSRGVDFFMEFTQSCKLEAVNDTVWSATSSVGPQKRDQPAHTWWGTLVRELIRTRVLCHITPIFFSSEVPDGKNTQGEHKNQVCYL